jgi:hypothetical protein
MTVTFFIFKDIDVMLTLSCSKCQFDLYARLTFPRSKILPQILTSIKIMEVIIYLPQFFWQFVVNLNKFEQINLNLS